MPLISQFIKCKCGVIVAGCAIPLCYTNKDWMNKVRDAVMGGAKIEYIPAKDVRIKPCTCKRKGESEDPNQLKIF